LITDLIHAKLFIQNLQQHGNQQFIQIIHM